VTDIPDDRELTESERRLVAWMLSNSTEEARGYLVQLERARVASRCPCGCASVSFVVAGRPDPVGPLHSLADFEFSFVGEPASVMVFSCNGTLGGIEVSSWVGETITQLPPIDALGARLPPTPRPDAP